MRKRVLAIALAVVAAIALVALRWHALVPAPAPELPSSQPKAARRASPVSAALAYHEGEGEAEPPDWQVTGIVVDEHAVPVPGSSLEVDLFCWHDGEQQPPPSRTDAEGRFSLELLPDCTMWLYASHAGASARLVAKVPHEPITLQLLRDNDLVLHVVDEKTHAPIPEPRVKDVDCGQPPCRARDAEVIGDRDGTVHLGRSHVIVVRATGYAERGLDVSSIWPASDERLPALERTIDLRAAPTVDGRLFDLDGAPVADTPVSYQPTSYDQGYYGLPPQIRTDGDGRFQITAPEGTPVYAGRGCIEGHYLEAHAIVAAGRLLELRLAKTTACRPPPPPPPRPDPPELDFLVTVVDEAGLPVPNAEIRSFQNGLRPGRADAAGRYAFRAFGAGDLYARRGERMSPLGAVDGEHREVTLQIQPAAITGTVRDGDGRPVAKAWVRVRVPRRDGWGGSQIRDQLTDPGGHFGFVLPPGRYLMSAFDETAVEDSYDGPNATVIATDTHDVSFEIR